MNELILSAGCITSNEILGQRAQFAPLPPKGKLTAVRFGSRSAPMALIDALHCLPMQLNILLMTGPRLISTAEPLTAVGKFKYSDNSQIV